MKTAVEVAQQFFERYGAHDLNGMIACFSTEGQIEYLPMQLSGPASAAGVGVWSTLIDAFPDLSNEITSTYFDAHASAAVIEVTISGTQAKDAFGIANRGQHFKLPHVFIVKTYDSGLIYSMKAYWDNQQLIESLTRSSTACNDKA
ncbi:nuclear transport factor 2 family protein [Pseudomonas sp. Teo4]|uniref:nuclear transport factor 2 family protein n=1 Tax=Pseudomonas sp. Teo4 TaxID=3064528 RepID=UPI002AB864A0|nr:nuclear transport factor 2 family protein [Pseudomonas sp. Teo4]MDZ3992740.1 hypothetical protein [Pseudomonas sp. Teo4]